jgi:putative acetyltransferase
MFKIRKFIPGDEIELYQLFYNAVHTINARDYNQQQLETWAPQEGDLNQWRESLSKNHTFVAYEEITGNIVGFADLEESGYIDRGYIHKDYLAQGVGLALLQAVEKKALALGIKELYADVSITAKKALEFKGYTVEKEQTAIKDGISFINYRMSKKL